MMTVVLGPRGAAWRVVVPTTRRGRARGLRGADPRPDEGILLPRCRSVHTFGMRVPITIAFLDASGRAVRVERASPGRLLICRRARLVFECHVGADMRIGDVLGVRGGGGGGDRRRRYTHPAAPLWP